MNNLDFLFEVMKVLKLTVVLVACICEYSKCQNCMICKVYLNCYKRKEYSCLEMLIKIKGFVDKQRTFWKNQFIIYSSQSFCG